METALLFIGCALGTLVGLVLSEVIRFLLRRRKAKRHVEQEEKPQRWQVELMPSEDDPNRVGQYRACAKVTDHSINKIWNLSVSGGTKDVLAYAKDFIKAQEEAESIR